MKVRRAGPADVDTVRPMVAMLHEHEELPMTPEMEHALRLLLGDPRLGRVLLCEDGGVPIGYAVLGFGFSLEFHGSDAFVDELFVLQGRRGRGAGRMLLAAAEAECQAAGIRALHLEVAHGNRAEALYRRIGYLTHERHLMTKWLAPGGHKPD